jgi:hypothetical protein
MTSFDYAPLQTYLRNWVARQPPGWQHRGAQDIADEWVDDLAFTSVRVARWLGTPEGEAITRVARAALPVPTNHAIGVIVEAIQIAGRQRTSKEIALTAVGGVAAAVLVYLALQN